MSSSQQQQQQPSSQPGSAGTSQYGQNRPRGTRGGGNPNYRGGAPRGNRGNNYRGNRGRGGERGGYGAGAERGGYGAGDRGEERTPRGVNLPHAESGSRGRGGGGAGGSYSNNNQNRFQNMMGGGGARDNRPDRAAKPETSQGRTTASQKFDALFGGSAEPSTASAAASEKVNLDSLMADGLAPTDKERKQSNVDKRKQSNVSSGQRKLSAIFADSGSSKPRQRYTKDDLLARFKQTTEIDMTVFKKELILDYADLFVSNGSAPQFTSSSKATSAATDEGKDPFDDMAEAAGKPAADTAAADTAAAGGLAPESIKTTQQKPDVPLQQTFKRDPNQKFQPNKGGNNYQKGGGYQGGNNQYPRNNNNQYRSNAAANYAAYDDDEDEDPEWGDFDPEKVTGNFFGREIPDEIRIRDELDAQRERWGAPKNKNPDKEDEFDALMIEKGDVPVRKEIGQMALEEADPDEMTPPEAETADIPGGKTLDEISEEVPQDIKDRIIDIEAEQQEKLRETMLRDVFQPKTSALQNLEEMFQDHPVVTNESLKLKMDTIGEIEVNCKDLREGMSRKQHLFSQLLTSINPFAQFILREMVDSDSENQTVQNWELDMKILQRHAGEVIKKEHLLKTSSEMYSIYMYCRDPTMLIKSDTYTDGEFKAVKDLVNVDDSLLVSSQMANSLHLLDQQEKLTRKASEPKNDDAVAAPEPTEASDTITAPTAAGLEAESREVAMPLEEDTIVEEAKVAPPAGKTNGEDALADLNAQLKSLLM